MMLVLFVMVTAVGAAPAKLPPPEIAKVDVSAAKGRMQVLTDGKQHYFVVTINESSKSPIDGPSFYGDGKAFYALRIPSGGSQGDGSWDLALWDPRHRWGSVYAQHKDDSYEVKCGTRGFLMTRVPADQSKELLDTATFYAPRWTRRPYRLARDDKGTYYFVDMLRSEGEDPRDPPPKRDMRLYVGPRGKLKLQQMTNIVSDSKGDIFATRGGELRLVQNQDDVRWISGKAELKLVSLPIEDNAQLIYTELGVYDHELLGTPCDDL